MKPIAVLIVEDKAIIAEGLKSTLLDAGYSVTGSVTSGEKALSAIEEGEPDIILMDIQLSGTIDGIETAEQIQKKRNIPIIYITDFHDEATIVRAKHTYPAAYLLKPFRPNDLLIAIDFALNNASKGKEAKPGENVKSEEQLLTFQDRVFVKEKDTWQRINLDDILWIEAGGSYCEIKTLQKSYVLAISLKTFSSRINHANLMRVHRSLAVNTDKVVAIKGTQLIIEGGGDKQIFVSESYKDELRKRFPMI